MHFGEFVDADPGVDLGGFESGAAEQLGDVSDVGGAFEHPRRRSVSEEVAGAGFGGAGLDIGADRTREGGFQWSVHGEGIVAVGGSVVVE